MCKFCDNHDDYYEGSLISSNISLGFGGELAMWVLIDPDTQKLAFHVCNESTSEQLEFSKDINFCPVCGKKLR